MTQDSNFVPATPSDTNRTQHSRNTEQGGVEQSSRSSTHLEFSDSEPSTETPLEAGAVVSAPLVDQALASTRVRKSHTGFAEHELAALKEELLSLEARVETFGMEIGAEAVKRVESFADRTRKTVRSRPLQSVAIALTVGMILGFRA